MENNKHLLDILWDKVGCDFLSDLKTKESRSAVLSAIRKTNKYDYSIEEWNETLSYIFGRSITISFPNDVDSVINLRCLQD